MTVPTPQPDDTGEAIRKEKMTDTTDAEIDRILEQWGLALSTDGRSGISKVQAKVAIQELVRAEVVRELKAVYDNTNTGNVYLALGKIQSRIAALSSNQKEGTDG